MLALKNKGKHPHNLLLFISSPRNDTNKIHLFNLYMYMHIYTHTHLYNTFQNFKILTDFVYI